MDITSKPPISAEDFIIAWQSAVSTKEVCEKTGLSLNRVRTRAREFRVKGVPLKEMPRPQRGQDWKHLADVARTNQPKKETT